MEFPFFAGYVSCISWIPWHIFKSDALEKQKYLSMSCNVTLTFAQKRLNYIYCFWFQIGTYFRSVFSLLFWFLSLNYVFPCDHWVLKESTTHNFFFFILRDIFCSTIHSWLKNINGTHFIINANILKGYNPATAGMIWNFSDSNQYDKISSILQC